MADDTSSSITGYETPTPQLDEDNQTLSSHSSLSDLSHAETLEPTTEGKLSSKFFTPLQYKKKKKIILHIH